MLASLGAVTPVWLVDFTAYLPDLDLGDWPTWISAIVSACALVAASAAAIFTARSVAIERDRDSRQEQAAIRQQAEKVTAVPGRQTVEFWQAGIFIDYRLGPAVEVLNQSTLPIYDVEVLVPDLSQVGLVPPNATRGGTFYWSAVLKWVNEERPEGPTPIPPALIEYLNGHVGYSDTRMGRILTWWETIGRCSIAFTDASGRRWQRHTDGTLELLRDIPAALGVEGRGAVKGCRWHVGGWLRIRR